VSVSGSTHPTTSLVIVLFDHLDAANERDHVFNPSIFFRPFEVDDVRGVFLVDVGEDNQPKRVLAKFQEDGASVPLRTSEVRWGSLLNRRLGALDQPN
jgi:hypothetical protein